MATKKKTTTATASLDTSADNIAVASAVADTNTTTILAKTLGATNDVKTLASFARIDYAGKGKKYICLKEEGISGTDIIIPTIGAHDGDIMYFVDTHDTYMFYKGTWYKQ